MPFDLTVAVYCALNCLGPLLHDGLKTKAATVIATAAGCTEYCQLMCQWACWAELALDFIVWVAIEASQESQYSPGSLSSALLSSALLSVVSKPSRADPRLLQWAKTPADTVLCVSYSIDKRQKLGLLHYSILVCYCTILIKYMPPGCGQAALFQEIYFYTL